MKLNYIEIPFEIKSIKEDDDGFFTFEGLASTFNEVDLGDDMIAQGAFVNSLKERTPIILWQHDTNEPIGMPTEIHETPEGLFLKAKLPKDDDLVRGRVIPQMRVGSIRKMSIGYSVADSSNDGKVRILKEIDLFEVSLVTFPMNTNASVSAFKSSGKMFCLEDVQEINDAKQLREFFKSTDIFTNQAREHILSKFLTLSDSSDDNGLSDSGDSDAEGLISAFKTLNLNLIN